MPRKFERVRVVISSCSFSGFQYSKFLEGLPLRFRWIRLRTDFGLDEGMSLGLMNRTKGSAA